MIRTKAIVINRFDYKENDNLVCFYTLDFGKLLLASRGTKKATSKLVAHLEPFNFVELMIIKNKNGMSVGSVISEDSFVSLKSDYNSIYLAGSFFNFFNKMIKEGQQDFELFFFLNDFLKTINKEFKFIESLNIGQLDFLIDIFKFRLLSSLGCSLNIDNCSVCKSKKDFKFLDFEQGGLVCGRCSVNTSSSNRVGIDDKLLELKKSIREIDFTNTLRIEENDKLHNLIKKKIVYFTNL